MLRKIDGGGQIEATATHYEVVAPNGEKASGKTLCDNKLFLTGWWQQNGGMNTITAFRTALTEINRELFPHNCG